MPFSVMHSHIWQWTCAQL